MLFEDFIGHLAKRVLSMVKGVVCARMKGTVRVCAAEARWKFTALAVNRLCTFPIPDCASAAAVTECG
jgi:hypothetical protein